MTTDTAPPAIQSMAETYLFASKEFGKYLDWRVCEICPEGKCGCGCRREWLEAAAMEAYTAFTEALDTWVTTLIQGRPYDTPLVEWEHRDLSPQAEHHDCIPVDDVKAAVER